MKTSIIEHLEQQQQTKKLFTLTTNKKKSDTAAFQGGSNSSSYSSNITSLAPTQLLLEHCVVCVEEKTRFIS